MKHDREKRLAQRVNLHLDLGESLKAKEEDDG